MSLKIEFVERASLEGANKAALCREYGISRETGHKWLRRFQALGYGGLEEESRRPRGAPLATAEDVVVAIVGAREAHPRWGPRKLTSLLRRRLGEATPSERTVARVLKRFGKLRQRRRPRSVDVVEHAPDTAAKTPNEVWTVDFKGWWRAGDGERCEPLTVRDAASRFVLAVDLLESTTADCVRVVFERLFRLYGVPAAIQCDNGTPFVSVHARGGLTKLSAWWVSLGIRLVRSRPGCPQDNGGHERMHADLAADVQASPEDTRAAQQRACDRWRQEFNHVRPHDALNGRTPAEVYVRSATKPRARAALYAAGWIVRRVRPNGSVAMRGERCFVSAALAGHSIALEPVGGFRWRAWFLQVDLGIVEAPPDERTILGALRCGKKAGKLESESTRSETGT